MKHAARRDGLMVIGVQREIDERIPTGYKIFTTLSLCQGFRTQFFFLRRPETS